MQFGMTGFQGEWEEGIVGIAKPARGWLRKQEVLFMNGIFVSKDFSS